MSRFAKKKRKRKTSCVLIVYDRLTNIGFNFDDVAEIRGIPSKHMDMLRKYCTETGEYEADNYTYAAIFRYVKVGEGRYRNLMDRRLSFLNRAKKLLVLPLDTELLPPIITPPPQHSNQRLHETYVLDKKRTIIIAPYAHGTKNLHNSIWIKLVSELVRKNNEYVLYTNVGAPDEKVIPGTKPIVTTLPEALYVAENVNCFIGLRSGLFDLLELTNARLLYINKSISQWWYYDLNLNYNHTNGRAFYIGLSERAEIQTFMEQNNISSIDDMIFCNHVKGSDVSFDAESLLKAIVDSVD